MHELSTATEIGMSLAALALVTSAVLWMAGRHRVNPHIAHRGRCGVLYSVLAAIIVGGLSGLATIAASVGGIR